MTVQNYINTDKGFCCPACGEEECSLLLINDPEYAERNQLPNYCKVEISEFGEFELVACGECGYIWAENEGVATTAQLKSLLLSNAIQKVRDCSALVLEEMIGDLDELNGIPREDQEDLLLYESGNNMDSCRIAYLSVFEEFIEKCSVEALVELYNNSFLDGSVEDVVETGEDLAETIKNNEPLKSIEVHVDD